MKAIFTLFCFAALIFTGACNQPKAKFTGFNGLTINETLFSNFDTLKYPCRQDISNISIADKIGWGYRPGLLPWLQQTKDIKALLLNNYTDEGVRYTHFSLLFFRDTLISLQADADADLHGMLTKRYKNYTAHLYDSVTIYEWRSESVVAGCSYSRKGLFDITDTSKIKEILFLASGKGDAAFY